MSLEVIKNFFWVNISIHSYVEILSLPLAAIRKDIDMVNWQLFVKTAIKLSFKTKKKLIGNLLWQFGLQTC